MNILIEPCPTHMCEDPYPDSKNKNKEKESPKFDPPANTAEGPPSSFDIPENGGTLEGFVLASPQVAKLLRNV